MNRPAQPVFITGNRHKAEYLAKLLEIELTHQKMELDEIQSVHLEDIVEHKVRQAYAQVQAPVLVEDVALEFAALSGLPGPFVKFFVDVDAGLEKLCHMLDGFDDRSARAVCVFGYYDGEELRLFRGELAGTIVETPRGSGGFGWDRIFAPVGYGGRTRAELSAAEDAQTYGEIKPLAQLRDFLTQ